MPQRTLKGINQKIVYRNERYTKGTVTTKDPLYEGSFRRLINFKISNQNASLENREPFLTVPLFNLNNEEIILSKEAVVFSLNEDTEHSFILDMQQSLRGVTYQENVLFKVKYVNNKFIVDQGNSWEDINFYVVDGDTINLNGLRYRLSIIDAPELEDNVYKSEQENKTRGQEAKDFLTNLFKNGSEFRISQFDFQSEKSDQFGRPMVYIFDDSDNMINLTVLEQGLATIYGINKFKTKERNFSIPRYLNLISGGIYITEYNFKEKFENAWNESIENPLSPSYSTYNDIKVNFNNLSNPKYYTKPVVHKIEKNTNLEFMKVYDNTNIDDPIFIEEKLIKRVVDTFEINELKVKEDLELFSDQNLKYEISIYDRVSKPDYTLTTSKYQDQLLNFLVKVYNENGVNLYTGLAEISRTSPNPDEGIVETFNLRTYKHPEVHIEIQDQTNYKPNILDETSIIPETLSGPITNVKGINNPRIDTVLLETSVTSNLQTTDENEPKFKRYLKTNRGIYEDFKRHYRITPFYKRPKINYQKNKYMYRWDLISMKEINLADIEEVERFNPFFRSAWTDLDSGDNISENTNRVRKLALDINSAKAPIKYLIIERVINEPLDGNDTNYFDPENIGLSTILPNESTVDDIYPNRLYTLDNEIEDFLENISLEVFRIQLTMGDSKEYASFFINNKEYRIRDIFNYGKISGALATRKQTDEIGITISSLKEDSIQTYENIKQTFEEVEQSRGKLSFLFLPYRVKVKSDDEDSKEEILYISSNTSTVTFNLEIDRKIKLPINIDVRNDLYQNESFTNVMNKPYIIYKERILATTQELEKPFINPLEQANIPFEFSSLYSIMSEQINANIKYGYKIPHAKTTSTEVENFSIDIEDFFKDGFVAVFYLTTYKDVESLTYDDVFYDQLAYKKTSAVYTFRGVNSNQYTREDFVRDKLQTESRALQYSNYISKFDDMTVLYGNPKYRNTIFLSEPGSPYYFGLVNAFEFDAEVVHVSQFKDILMVFTSNDIWVLYWFEERLQMQDAEGKYYEQINMVIRQKKILYNVSTEHKNKNSIKNLTRYVTIVSNNVLYLITPSSYIADDTQFSLKILSQNIEHLMADPLTYINERLVYYEIKEAAKEYKFNLRASDNLIKLYYSVEVGQTNIPYTLILTYDVLNNRWSEEDTITFGDPNQIYMIDSTTGYEMLTQQKSNNYLTYQTDKFKNLIMDDYGQSNYDLSPVYGPQRIKYYIDTGYLKLSEHLRKRFRQLLINMRNINSKEILFTYNFTIDDIQYASDFEPEYTTNNSNEIIEVEKMNIKQIVEVVDNKYLEEYKFKIKYKEDFNIGFLDNFLLDFSYLTTSDIMMLKHNLIGRGRLPRIKMGFSAMGKFYILSFGIVYTEKGGK